MVEAAPWVLLVSVVLANIYDLEVFNGESNATTSGEQLYLNHFSGRSSHSVRRWFVDPTALTYA